MHHANPGWLARWGVPLVVLPLAVAGCDGTGSTNPSNRGTVSVYVKDAPGNVDSVWVQVNDIVLVGRDGETSLLDQPTGLLNLTMLRDSALALVESHYVSPGSFSDVRFALGGAVLETSSREVYALGGAEDPDGLPTTRTLQCPSCAESGVSVQLGHDLVVSEGDSTRLILDFDLTRSFGHPASSSDRWVMHPVIRGQIAAPGEIRD